MYKKNISKKTFAFLIIFMLLLIYIPSIDGKIFTDQNKYIKTDDLGVTRFGIIFGPYKSKILEDDILVISVGPPLPIGLNLNYFTLFGIGQLREGQQIKLTQFSSCIFTENFTLGFCNVYFPQSDISMNISSQNDQENKIIWTVENLTGDNIWVININVEVYTELGEEYHSFSYGPLWEGNLSVGDKISIKTNDDGNYSVRFIESVSRYVLFESPLVKY